MVNCSQHVGLKRREPKHRFPHNDLVPASGGSLDLLCNTKFSSDVGYSENLLESEKVQTINLVCNSEVALFIR
jgi:hypothetical protein